jgi:hypothetical protein
MTVNRQQSVVVNKMDGDSPLEQEGSPSSGVQDHSPTDSTEVSSPTVSQSRPESKNGTQEELGSAEAGLTREKGSSSGRSTPSRGGTRSTSSKFASLRATFEQKNAADRSADGSRRRPTTSEKPREMTDEQKQIYEAEIARLKDELEKEKELRVAFEEKVTTLEEEVERLTEALEQRDEQWRKEFEMRSAQLMDEAELRIDTIAKEARSRQNEATNLHRQLADLKQTIASSTRAGDQVSDATLRQEFEIIQHEVQNWVVNHFRRVKCELSPAELCGKLERVVETKQLERLKSVYETFTIDAKISMYQATVACYMMEIFEEPYLFGLREQRDWGKRSRQAADALQNVFDRETYSHWRASTFNSLRQYMEEPVNTAADGLAELICIALKALTEAEETEQWHSSLKPILLRAISFAHLIRVQRAQYHFILPEYDESFDLDTMDDIAEEKEGKPERTVRCATFPSVTKVVDEDGGDNEQTHVLVKAKVLCNDEVDV